MTGITGVTGISEGTIEANGLRFGYLAAGDTGPLPLCLHGFPDSAWTWRHLLPRRQRPAATTVTAPVGWHRLTAATRAAASG